jgi:LemA protein
MKGWMAGAAVAAVILVAFLLVGGSYVSAKNTMVTKSEDVRQAYAQVDVIQQQRLDLIPNLVASVKGYVNEETTVLTNIANARAGVIAAQGNQAASVQANQKLDVAISPLLRLQEAYPNLKSNEQFRMLTDNLAGMENRLAVERRRYDRTLEDYNVYIQQFPNSIWAGMAGYHYRDEYFKADAAAREAPKVDFSK